MLQQVIVEARRLDETDWAVRAASRLAFHVYYSTGRYDEAVRCLSEAIDLQSGRARHHAVYLTLIAEFHVECGRYDDALATLDQARQIGARLGERLVMAYDAWTRARMASQQQHAEETISLVREVELHRGDWFSEHSTGVEFLADAAALLDRVGAHAAAAEYLGRAVERRTEAPVEVAIAEAAIAARSGDPTHATDLLAAVSAMPMLKAKTAGGSRSSAYAALRAGDAGAGALAAQAFKSAAALGYPISRSSWSAPSPTSWSRSPWKRAVPRPHSRPKISRLPCESSVASRSVWRQRRHATARTERRHP